MIMFRVVCQEGKYILEKKFLWFWYMPRDSECGSPYLYNSAEEAVNAAYRYWGTKKKSNPSVIVEFEVP